MTMTKKTGTAATTETNATGATGGVQVLAIRTDIAVPLTVSNRGSSSKYPFDQLAAPDGEKRASFGLIGKSARNMASVINAANKRYRRVKLDEQGQPMFETKNVKGEMKSVPMYVYGRQFKAVDIAPEANDPDNASVRVFRIV